jgi:N-acetylglucosaminyldiphosphoundecaprenol N-acetyl-beta-D-mannosaminyltransferase
MLPEMIAPTRVVDVPRVNILGVWIHNVTRDEMLNYTAQMIALHEPHLISTPNIDYIVKAQSDSKLRAILNSTDLTVPDGMGIIYASRFLHTPLKMNVGGRRTVPEMCRLAAQRGFRVYFLGSKPGVAERAVERLKGGIPGLPISGIQHGYFTEQEENQVITAIRHSRSDILILALGTPKQEKWMARHKNDLGVSVTIGVGSTLDRISGDVSAPPKWMTDVGLEWLYRVAQEPRRLGKRYLVDDPIFFWWVFEQRLKARDFGSSERQ